MLLYLMWNYDVSLFCTVISFCRLNRWNLKLEFMPLKILERIFYISGTFRLTFLKKKKILYFDKFLLSLSEKKNVFRYFGWHSDLFNWLIIVIFNCFKPIFCLSSFTARNAESGVRGKEIGNRCFHAYKVIFFEQITKTFNFKSFVHKYTFIKRTRNVKF